MSDYSVQFESARILKEHLLDILPLPKEVVAAAQKITITGDDDKPFIPTPCKLTESATSLTALLAATASAINSDRYGIDYQKITVNTDLATLFILSVMLPTVNGESFFKNDQLLKEMGKGDLHLMSKPIHQECTNVYQTKDGRWYHLHGSMNAAASMKMMGVEEQDVTREEAIDIYKEKMGQWDAALAEKVANEEYKQAGVTCYTPEEFFETEQGKIMAVEPLWNETPLKAPKCEWPTHGVLESELKPLAGIKVIDFSRVIAAPVISKLLALLGADVIKVTSSKLPDIGFTWVDLNTGKQDTDIDMKSEQGKRIFSSLVEEADVLIDGYRPGALERLGFDSVKLRHINPSLIYTRENCYGFKGPLARRSGWQQISDCLVGISWLQGKFMGLNEPVVPLLPNSDYQTGIIGAIAIMQALLARTKNEYTYDVDVSLTQYNIWYYRLGQYTPEQQRALLARNEGFHVRHYDEMQTLLVKTFDAIKKTRPEILTDPAHFQKISGKAWGLGEDISILAPAFTMEKTKLEYEVPSGSRGRSAAEWLS